MNIIELAREAGFYVGENLSGVPLVGHKKLSGLLIHLDVDDLERFAQLVRNATLEEAAKVISAYQIPVGNSAAGELACEWTHDALKQVRDEILALKEQE